MQFENHKHFSAHHQARETNSCDDAQEKVDSPSVPFAENLPANSNSILARRRLQAGFSLKPLDTKLKNKKPMRLCMSGLLEDMKAKVSSIHRESYNSQSHNDADYIFVNPSCSSKQRGKKEMQIDELLNGLGIFQINVGIAMKEYNF